MKIAFFELEPEEKKYFSDKFLEHDLILSEEVLDENFSDSLEEVEAASVFIYSKITPKLLKRMPKLKLITTRSTGFDHIDCTGTGIKVANVPNYGENTVAEHTFALILALSRKIIESVKKTSQGEFSSQGLRGFDIFGKTIGIIGAGRIGTRVAEIAQAFGMKVLSYDIKKNPKLVERGVQYLPLEEVLKRSDIVSLHCRHTAETHHLIDAEKLQLFKPGSYLINTARGGLIDTHALLDALDSGVLAGAALDVLEEEGSIKEDMMLLSKRAPKNYLMINIANNILIRKPNVIITPHNAFNSSEALNRIMETTAENIRSFQKGAPTNLVS